MRQPFMEGADIEGVLDDEDEDDEDEIHPSAIPVKVRTLEPTLEPEDVDTDDDAPEIVADDSTDNEEDALVLGDGFAQVATDHVAAEREPVVEQPDFRRALGRTHQAGR